MYMYMYNMYMHIYMYMCMYNMYMHMYMYMYMYMLAARSAAPPAWDGDGGSREGMHDRVGFSRISGLAWDVPGVCMHDAGCSCVWSQCSMGQWPSEAGQAFFVCARGRGAKDIWAYGKVIAARNKRRL